MTTEETEFDFTGSQGAEHAAEVMQGGFEREIEFLALDGSPAGKATGKDSMVLRFVTDSARRSEEPPNKYNLAWITVAGHYASTKAKPPYAREGQNWPTKMGCGCRKDPVFTKKYGGACFVCDTLNSKPGNRTWALAIERVEVKDPDTNAVLGWADKTREVFDTDANGDLIVLSVDGDKKTYQKKTVPAWIIVSQGWRNFFQPLSGHVAYFQKQSGGSGLLDGDWLITRTGSGNNDTSYTAIRVAEQQIPQENPWGVPGGTKYDLSLRLGDGTTLMQAIYPDMPDLRKILSDRVSEDYFGRFFIPGWLPEGFDPAKAQQQGGQTQTHGMVMGAVGQPGAPSTPATEEAPSSALDALKNRVMASSAPAATPAATPETQQS